MKHIVAVTTSRADYGILRPILQAIATRPRLRADLVTMDTNLAQDRGQTLREIEADGFAARVLPQTAPETDDPHGIAGAMAAVIHRMAGLLVETRPDILLVAGDRFETFAAASAAVPFTLPCAHIHGGESTEGAIDEAFRHAISKMSHLHFPSAEAYGRRLAQMGEESWRIHVCGAPSLDNLRSLRYWTQEQLESRLNLDLDEPTLLVTLHPETLAYQHTDQQIATVLQALDEIGFQAVFTAANADTWGGRIRRAVDGALARTDRYRNVASLGQAGYFGLMRHAVAMVGNSSSGLIEAPSFKLPAVNIGERQKGRIRAANVLDVPCDSGAISAAIRTAVSPEFQASLGNLSNPYGDGHAAERIVDVLERTPINQRLLRKRFVDGTLQNPVALRGGA